MKMEDAKSISIQTTSQQQQTRVTKMNEKKNVIYGSFKYDLCTVHHLFLKNK